MLILLGAYTKILMILILNIFNDYNSSKIVIMVKMKIVHLIIT